MKMNDFLNQIMESTNKAQFNIDKKKSNVILFLRGRHYAVRSIVIDPFKNCYNVILIPNAGISFSKDKFITIDHIYYLNARKSLMTAAENDINFVLIDGNDSTYIPVGTIDIKEQTIAKVKAQGTGTLDVNVIYYFK